MTQGFTCRSGEWGTGEIPRDLSSWMKTDAWIVDAVRRPVRSVECGSRSRKAVGRVRLRTSRNRRSMALVVPTCLRPARVLQRKQASRSSRSLRREATAPGQVVSRRSAMEGGAGRAEVPALMIPAGAWRPRGRQPSPRFGPPACISFTLSNACGRLPVVAACRGIGGLLLAVVVNHREYPTPA